MYIYMQLILISSFIFIKLFSLTGPLNVYGVAVYPPPIMYLSEI